MAATRMFISSTCYDLSEVRNIIKLHVEQFGIEAVVSDDHSFGVDPGKHSHQACLDEVERSDYMVLIIGGRRGGTYIGSEKSITNEEYVSATRKRIPILTFVKKDVLTAQRFYKKNPNADLSDYVDDKRVFDFIDIVHSASESNWIWPFENGEDICKVLTSQISHILKLYSESFVAERTPNSRNKNANRVIKFPGKLNQLPDDYSGTQEESHITSGLRSVHNVLTNILNSNASGKDEKIKFLWVMGRYGKHYGPCVEMNNDKFKQFAWSVHRGQRVLNQIKVFGVSGEYVLDDENRTTNITIEFDATDDSSAGEALCLYVTTLVDKYGEDAGLDLFRKANMTLFS